MHDLCEEVRSIRDSAKVFDPASFEFSEFLLSNLGSDGKFPFWSKCLGFSALLYLAGVVANSVSDTLVPGAVPGLETPYLMDYSFMMVCIALGCTLALLLSTIRKLDDALIQVNERIGALSTPADEKKFMDFILWMKQWMPAGERFYEGAVFWYHIDTIGGAAFGGFFALYWSLYSTHLWWGRSQYVVSALYFIAFCAIISYIGGAIIFVTMGSIKAVRRYCKTFISHERILALNPESRRIKASGSIFLGLGHIFCIIKPCHFLLSCPRRIHLPSGCCGDASVIYDSSNSRLFHPLERSTRFDVRSQGASFYSNQRNIQRNQFKDFYKKQKAQLQAHQGT